ncbi:MAG TPA: CRISPR system precrRNA processing endoribonuclease RAMP protein Cas6 [Atribacteraceae bacterium]|nr:CRISPR system precrRNA processing endoribonuclease RAMP protein Cas6 [Atribacteraceae bacterium]
MFDFFRIARYRITLAAGKQGLILPPYKGATFRGGFGTVFRRIACAVRGQDCLSCLLKAQCPYAYIFETSPPENSQALSKYESIPRPFVLEPPTETKTFYAPGETLDFQLLLFGRAIQYLPYFIVVFREMGETGLGRGRRPFVLTKMAALGRQEAVEIYSAQTNTIRHLDQSDTYCPPQFPPPSQIQVNFITPVRLIDDGACATVPEFHILFRQIMRRISALAYFHHGQRLEADYGGLAARSRQINLSANKTSWQELERYSRRQDQRINIGGLVGAAAYQGNLTEFMPWLALGEYVHVGKNTVFGLGKYELTLP